MSGGHFDYYQWQIDEIANSIEEFKKGLDIIRKAYIYAQRIDWLLSGDDDEKSFHERLKEDFEKYYSQLK